MDTELSRALRNAIYLATLIIAALLGYYIAYQIDAALITKASMNVIFTVTSAILIFSLNNLEDSYIWGSIFTDSTEQTWIGSKSNLLSTSLPAPISMGISVGQILYLMF